LLKEVVQWKLMWVRTSANRWVLASDRGTGHCFSFFSVATVLYGKYFRFRSVLRN
jgi:hypothetical protein